MATGCAWTTRTRWSGPEYVHRYDALAVWLAYADDVRGHFLPEEAPEPALPALGEFVVA